jgi:beta-lactamase regulating signal transducer with metallopeptidase domain
MNWQSILIRSGTADWILLAVFHSLWLSLAGLLLLYIRKLKAPAVRATWCTALLIVLLSLPAITLLTPRIDIYPHPEKNASAGLNSKVAVSGVATGNIQPSKPAPLVNRMLGLETPLPKVQSNWWMAVLNGFGILWIAFTLGGIGRIFYELIFLKGYCSGLEEVKDARLSAILEEVRKYFGFRKTIRFFVSSKLTSPISIGIRTPSVIFPINLYQGIDNGELRAILLHELAHIHHSDHILGVFQRFIKSLYWWNPFVHRLCNTLSVAREEVSDNYAISGMGSAARYADLLVNLVEKTCLINSLPCTAGMANPYISLENRIKYLLSKERDMSIKTNKKTIITVALATVLFCGFVAIGSQVEIFAINQTSSSNTPIDGWFKAGSVRQDYEIGEDRSVYFSGPSSYYIFSISEKPQGFGTIMKNMPPANYLGKRVRMSAYIKTENLSERAGMWMRVDGKSENPLAFDNMNSRPITGTSTWKRYEIVLDVSENAINIAFGVLVAGSGKVWIDDVQFDIVDSKQVQTTGMRVQQDYETGEDFNTYYTAPSSSYLVAKTNNTEDFGTILKSILPGDFRGKRVRMSAYIKTENVAGWVGMWMRVDGPSDNKQPLAFDNMQYRPITGTTDWQRCEIVLDVPDAATDIVHGVLLRGAPGKVWIDEIKF